MFYITKMSDEHTGYHELTTASAWEPWLRKTIVPGLTSEIRSRLVSNLKHILASLDMKAALIVPHQVKPTGRPLLFASYAQMLHFEFCVGVFSVAEGIGSSRFLVQNGKDGSAGDRVGINSWKPVLAEAFDASGAERLLESLETVKSVRDKLHQDSVGAREKIDWHAFSYEAAFAPAFNLLWCMMKAKEDAIPESTFLRPGNIPT